MPPIADKPPPAPAPPIATVMPEVPAPPIHRLPREVLVGLAFTLVVGLLVTLSVVFIDLLSAARAYIGGESQWSKAQKIAVQHLLVYSESRDEADWQQYQAAIAVPLSDRRAREAMDRPVLDDAEVFQGLVGGGNHPDDVPRMVRLYRGFGHLPFMRPVIATWAEGDARIAELDAFARRLHAQPGPGGSEGLRRSRAELLRLDAELTALETRFSGALADTARLAQLGFTLTLLLLAVVLVAAATLFTHRLAQRGQRQQAALRESEVRLRALWETTQDSVLIVDREHRIVFCNPAVQATFGWSPEELQGQPLSQLQPPPLRAAHAAGVARYHTTGRRNLDWRGVEVLALHRSGHEFPVEIAFSELRLDEQTYFVGFLRDITRRKQAEDALREANEQLERRVADRTAELTAANEQLRELDRLKSEFLATISHELRTPLNAILGFSALLRDGRSGPVTPAQVRQLGLVHNAGQHLLSLINDLLDVSRIEAGGLTLEPEDFDLADVLDEVAATLQPALAGKPIRLSVDGPPLLLHNDRRRCYQVLLNLAGNAVKFTPEGRVQLTARFDGDGRQVRVDVRDTGIGIPPEQLPRLFEAFRQVDGSLQRQHDGVGLGLYLCRQLMTLMGGTIEVASEVGAGSVFTVRWPVTHVVARPTGAVTGSAAAP